MAQKMDAVNNDISEIVALNPIAFATGLVGFGIVMELFRKVLVINSAVRTQATLMGPLRLKTICIKMRIFHTLGINRVELNWLKKILLWMLPPLKRFLKSVMNFVKSHEVDTLLA